MNGKQTALCTGVTEKPGAITVEVTTGRVCFKALATVWCVIWEMSVKNGSDLSDGRHKKASPVPHTCQPSTSPSYQGPLTKAFSRVKSPARLHAGSAQGTRGQTQTVKNPEAEQIGRRKS